MSDRIPGPDHRFEPAPTLDLETPALLPTVEAQVLETFAPGGILHKYAAALLPAVVILFGAVQLVLPGGITGIEGGQLIALVASLITTYVLPLATGRWAGLLKTGAALLGSVATLVIPLVVGFTWESLLIVAIALLQALATEIGVQVRKDQLSLAA